MLVSNFGDRLKKMKNKSEPNALAFHIYVANAEVQFIQFVLVFQRAPGRYINNTCRTFRVHI